VDVGRPLEGFMARYCRRAEPRSHGIDHFTFVPKGDEAAGELETARGRPQDLRAGQPPPGEARRRRVSGVAAVLPVDVPAGPQPEMEPEADLGSRRPRHTPGR